MALTITRGFSFASNETVTNSKLHQLVENATITGIELSNLSANAQAGINTFKNRLINAAFRFDQRNAGASTAVADDVYAHDRWYILTQTAAVNVSQLTDPEDGYTHAMRLTQNQAAAQRMGFAQIIEGKNCKDLRGGSGILVPRIRCSSAQAIRYAVIGWTGTVDAVISDFVNDWTSSTYTAGNFFTSTTTSVLAVGAHTPSAATWTSLTQLTASLGSTFNNIAIIVWTEGTAAQNVTLDVDFVQFEKGSTASAFERVEYETEFNNCRRYYQKTYSLGAAPGAASDNNGFHEFRKTSTSVDYLFRLHWDYQTRMRGAPTITWYAFAGTSGSATFQSGTRTVTGIRTGETCATGEASNGAASTDHIAGFHATAAVEL